MEALGRKRRRRGGGDGEIVTGGGGGGGRGRGDKQNKEGSIRVVGVEDCVLSV